MAWTERQLALLRGLGLRVWSPAARTPAADAEAPADADADAMASLHVAAGPALAVQPSKVPARSAAAVTESPRPAAPPAPAAVEPRPERPTARPARPAQVSALQPVGPSTDLPQDWEALAERVAGCTACGLCTTRRQTVFGVGHRQARVMVIGEAPGEQEDRQGEPFVGPAGQLLDRMLQAVGLSRSEGPAEQQVYIANTLKCRPPGNRNPSPEELARCVPFLQQQVALVRPELILAMGRFAVQALLSSDEPLGRLRGRVHQWQGVPVVVSYHPAYLLRQPADKAKSWADLCLAMQVLEQGAPA